MSIFQKIKDWYRGKYVSPKNERIVSIKIDPEKMQIGRFERPHLAKIFNALIRFWLNHWQWIIGTIIALIGLYILYLQLLVTKS